jgi:hypothetical protein
MDGRSTVDTKKMVESASHYTYRPLDPDRREFRLVKLKPSTQFSSPVCCELVETQLRDHPPYEAISYVWGDPRAKAPVHVEDAILHVTVNLECALRYLRWEHEARWLWVDAISINQKDINERNHQVRLMKDVYSCCTADLIWFGEASNDTELGVATLKRMKTLDLQRITQHGVKSFNNQVAVGDLDGNAYLALCGILVRPKLWERVWVMQEIALCPKAIMVFGHLTMPWDILSGILDHSGVPDQYHLPFSHQRFEHDVWDAFAKSQVVEHQRDAVQGLHRGYNSNLLDVLSRFRATQSTDPRDKIYGLLGLATDTFGIQPDYRKSVCEVYLDVARAYIDQTQNLDIICQSQWPLGGAEERRSDLPSWLVDFTCQKSTKILFAQRDIFCAGSKTCPTPISLTTAGELRLVGNDLGLVASLKNRPKYTYSGGETFGPSFRYWMPDPLISEYEPDTPPFATTITKAPNYFTGEDAFQAYWRTLMTDCVAYPTARLDTLQITKYSEIFWNLRARQAKTPKAPGGWDKYDGDKDLLYEIGRVAGNLGINDIIRHWRFAVSEGGFYCMIPTDAAEGDQIAVMDGAKVPLVLRSTGESSDGIATFKFIGTAYVHGFMDGLARSWVQEGKLQEKNFILV